MAGDDALTRFSSAARLAGIDVKPVRYPEGTRTAVDAAAAIGCEVGQIIKSLVCTGPNGAVLVLTAGHNRVDLERLAEIVGAEIRMATADEARSATGYSIGGTPPFGHIETILTLIDPDLLVHNTVYGAAGTPDTCFPISPAQLMAATRATQESFTVT